MQKVFVYFRNTSDSVPFIKSLNNIIEAKHISPKLSDGYYQIYFFFLWYFVFTNSKNFWHDIFCVIKAIFHLLFTFR